MVVLGPKLSGLFTDAWHWSLGGYTQEEEATAPSLEKEGQTMFSYQALVVTPCGCCSVYLHGLN